MLTYVCTYVHTYVHTFVGDKYVLRRLQGWDHLRNLPPPPPSFFCQGCITCLGLGLGLTKGLGKA